MANYPKKRVAAQVIATGLKSEKLAVGTKLTVESINMFDPIVVGTTERFKDFALCNSGQKQVKVPMNEFLRFKTKDGKPVYQNEGESENSKLPNSLTIEGSTDRKDRNGNTIYPYSLTKSRKLLLTGL